MCALEDLRRGINDRGLTEASTLSFERVTPPERRPGHGNLQGCGTRCTSDGDRLSLRALIQDWRGQVFGPCCQAHARGKAGEPRMRGGEAASRPSAPRRTNRTREDAS